MTNSCPPPPPSSQEYGSYEERLQGFFQSQEGLPNSAIEEVEECMIILAHLESKTL